MNNFTLEPIFAGSSEPLILVNSDGAIVWSNAAADRLLGAPAAGKPALSVLGQSVGSLLKRLPHYGSTETWVPSPELGPVHQTAVLLEISSDIGEELYLVALKSTAAEGTAVREREQWLGTVAHDLKTPLGAIFSYSDTLLETPIGASMEPSQKALLARIRATAARATELVRNYQHLSQLEMRAVMPSTAAVDLNSVIHEVVLSTWREDTEKPPVLVQCAPVPVWVRAEKLHLERVVTNLFTNALKFSSVDTPVVLRTGSEDGAAWLSVTNQGPIITDDDRKRLFKPFSRLASAKGKPGSGIGLTIVKQIVDGLGGVVTVTSSAQAGTTFTVAFN
jgi:signal transduction histidine kinase